MAASCGPGTANKAATVAWRATQESLTNDGSDDGADTAVVGYAFTNTGPDTLSSGTVFNVELDLTIYSFDVATATVAPASSNVSSAPGAATTVTDNGDGTETRHFVLPFKLSADVPAGATFAVTVTARVGAETSPATTNVKVDSSTATTDCDTQGFNIVMNNETAGDPYGG